MLQGLSDILVREAYVFLFASFRLVPLMVFAPFIGDKSIPQRIKVSFAIVMSIAIYGAIERHVPPIPQAPFSLVYIFLFEAGVGAMIGLTTRLLLSAAHVAGTIAAFLTGLAAAQSFDPSLGGQSAILSTFMTLVAVTLLVVTDMHHLMLYGVVNSYSLFPSGEAFPIADFAGVVSYYVSASFDLGVRISAPFLVYAIIYNLGLGLIAKLAPRIQVFFVVMPLNIYLGFALFMVLIPSIMWLFLDHFRELLSQFLS